MNDSIGDMIIRIKNAGISRKESVLVPFSKLKFEIATVLEKEGYIASVAKKGKKVAKFIELGLIYDSGESRVQGVRRVSKLSRRVYRKASELRPVKNGLGISIVSTPKGLLSGKNARKERVGGEVLFEIW